MRLENIAGGVADLQDIHRLDLRAAVGEGAVCREMVDHPDFTGTERGWQRRIELGRDPHAGRGRQHLLDPDFLEEMDG